VLTRSVAGSLGNSPRKPRQNKLKPATSLSLVPIVNGPVRDRSKTASYSLKTARSNSKKPATFARTAAEPFSPNRPKQRLNHRRYSPAVLAQAVCTATATRSFEEAAKVLILNADLTISPRHLQTLCREVGDELVHEQRARTKAFRERPLNTPAKRASPPVALAVVMVDGGRIQTRKPGHGPGVHQAAWRESKTALLLRMTHEPSAIDPQPDLPLCFAHPLATVGETPRDPAPVKKQTKGGERLFRSGLATLKNSDDFAWQTAAAAENRGFFSARARAFVSDGQTYNWTIQRRHFGSFEPILDFVHASEHVHNAARALGEPGERWAEACWQGRVSEVLSEMSKHRSRLTPPPNPQNEPEHPWCLLSREIGYLTNNQPRMDYPRYRQAGLPITSSPIESWVKQLNQRVKGSEKFWNDDANGEAILHLRSAWLGDDEGLTKHLNTRRGHPRARPRGAETSCIAA
jgi:hypothetical protein